MVIKDSLYGFAIGDAIGVPIEFESRNTLFAHPVTNMLGYGSYDVPKGVWSDDTSMTLATIDSIITNNNKINYNDIAENFCKWINDSKYTATGEIFDIGITTKYALIRYWDSRDDATKCGGTSYSENGNGSLMRMLPIVLYCYYNKIKDIDIFNIVKNVSSITHAHEISICGCYLYVRYLLFILSGKNKFDSYKLLGNIDYSMFTNESLIAYNRILNGDLSGIEIDKIDSSGYIVSTLESVLWVILNTENFDQAIIGAINLGGDTDTIGAITGSIAGVLYGYDSINTKWIDDLKNKELLDEYIRGFDQVLNKDNDQKTQK